MRKLDLKDFELSQAYLFYWDKLEKANFFLEQIVDTATEDLDSRLVQTLLSSPVGDGGQWDMVANLVEKYGLVWTFIVERSPLTSSGAAKPISRFFPRNELASNG